MREAAAAARGLRVWELHGLEHRVREPPHPGREVVVEAPKLRAAQLVQPPGEIQLVRRVQRVKVALVLRLHRVAAVGGMVVVVVALDPGMSARVAQDLPI